MFSIHLPSLLPVPVSVSVLMCQRRTVIFRQLPVACLRGHQ